jgi:hypothetical protein
MYIRGVLGNKSAGQHKFKTVQIREIVFKIKYAENTFLHIKASSSLRIGSVDKTIALDESR